MKINEILLLAEAEPVFTDPNHKIPVSTDAINISGNYPISCQIGNFDVFELKSGQFIYYFVRDKEGKDVAYSMVLPSDPPYVQTKMVFTTIKGKGIIPGLYTFLVRNHGLKLLSDYRASTEGMKLWQSLPIKAPLLHIRVADVLNGTEYDLSDVKGGKCKTEDGIDVILPEKDTKPAADNQDMIRNNPKQFQRFIYVAEGLQHVDARKNKERNLIEQISKPFVRRGPVPFPKPCFGCHDGIYWMFEDEID